MDQDFRYEVILSSGRERRIGRASFEAIKQALNAQDNRKTVTVEIDGGAACTIAVPHIVAITEYDESERREQVSRAAEAARAV